MFGPNMGGGVFSLTKVLGGISKTLGVVNQIIPIYKETKPMIQNFKSAVSLVKEFGSSATTRINNNKEKNIKPIKEKINTIKSANFTTNSNNPTFFQ